MLRKTLPVMLLYGGPVRRECAPERLPVAILYVLRLLCSFDAPVVAPVVTRLRCYPAGRCLNVFRNTLC